MSRSHFVQLFFSILAFFVGRRPLASQYPLDKAESILLFKPDGIGDFILWSAVFQEFARRCPHVKFTFLCCAPTGQLASVMFPFWRVIEIPRRPPSLFRFSCMLLRNPRLLLTGKQDLLVDLRSHRASWELLYVILLRGSRKIGLQRPVATIRGTVLPEKKFFDQLVAPEDSKAADGAEQECAELGLVNQLSLLLWGSTPAATLPDLRWVSWPQPNINFGKRVWVIGPFSGHAIRDYPLQLWREALQHLVTRIGSPDQLLICGALSQKDKAENFKEILNGILPAENLCGRIDLAETAGLLTQSELVFATESALAHLSVALRKRTTVILGGGHYGLFAPWGTTSAPVRWLVNRIDCYGCNWACIHQSALCIQNIPAAKVVESVLELFSRGRT